MTRIVLAALVSLAVSAAATKAISSSIANPGPAPAAATASIASGETGGARVVSVGGLTRKVVAR